jgi:hypothetical protein
MTIAIKDRETITLLEEIGAATGREVGDVVLDIVRREAERIRREREAHVECRRALIVAAADRYAARVGPNPPPHDELLGYDAGGLPR